jgi:hypothetical protein
MERHPADGSERTGRSAGVAGVVFAVLFVASLVAASVGPPDGLGDSELVAWFKDHALTWTTIGALYLAPIAGIAFLWFVGVIRARIGTREDQLFATVFLGSGLLFVAMYWSAAAHLASIVGGNRFDAAPELTADRLDAVRSFAFAFLFVLAARAAAVFVIVTSTIVLRWRVAPRALALTGYAVGLVMLLSLSFLEWIVLLFPAWVFVISAWTIVANRWDRPAGEVRSLG